jgi:hypothetical protein
MMKRIILSTSLLLILSVVYVQAQSQTPRTDTRQKVQRARIAEGRLDGDLTKREATSLKMEQRHIRRAERRAKADGVVTPREKMRLERKQNRANRHIRRAKHNSIEKKD